MSIGSDASELIEALAGPCMFHAYQPIVHLDTAQVVGVEALVRWQHESLGLLAPDTFLPLIYGAGLADEFTRFGIARILADLPKLRSLHGDQINVSLNLSGRQLIDPAIATKVILDEFDKSGESPSSLTIEVVEDATTSDLRRSSSAFADLRAHGVQIVLDDFGTGASSLTVLTEAAYDGLKIDRTFIQGIVSNATARSVVDSVLAFGRSTGISVVAEGVESSLELHTLTELGCPLGQGYHFGKPAPLAADAHPHETDLRDTDLHDSDLHDSAALHITAPDPGVSAAVAPAASNNSDSAELAEIMRRALEIDPRSSVHSFDSTFEKLEQLDIQAQRFGRAGFPARCEIGYRVAVATTYHGRYEATTTWAMRTSRFAEELERWGRSAEMLALVAATPWEHGTNPTLPVDALTRALHLRVTAPMELDDGTRVDNAIGATYGDLGLTDHAWRWWKESVTRHGDSGTFGSAMCCLNFAELQLEMLEGEIAMSEEAHRELAIAFLDQVLDRLQDNPFSPAQTAVSLRCRLELAKGNTDQAIAEIEKLTETGKDFVSNSTALRAHAQLARAQGRSADFLDHTNALMDLLATRPLLNHHDWSARTLHAQALLANGQTNESVELSQQLLRTKQLKDSAHLTNLLDWIQRKVDLTIRYDEISASPVIASGEASGD